MLIVKNSSKKRNYAKEKAGPPEILKSSGLQTAVVTRAISQTNSHIYLQ